MSDANVFVDVVALSSVVDRRRDVTDSRVSRARRRHRHRWVRRDNGFAQLLSVGH